MAAPELSVLEHVVLVEADGRPGATVPKAIAHGVDTLLHLAFSCHVVGPDQQVLLTRRAATKRTWPGVWTNACCGHPQAGETLRQAVTRRLHQELGVRPTRLTLAVPDFAYRAVMADGTVEHEICPVVVAEVSGPLAPDPGEVDGHEWVGWEQLVAGVAADPARLSPWATAQVAELEERGGPWAAGSPASDRLLDELIGGAPVSSPSWRRHPVLVSLGAHVQPVLQEVLRRKEREARLVDPALVPLVQQIRALVDAGGKRLRPAFTYWGHRATGSGHSDGVLAVGAAVELLHTFALLHDDVMDRSATRRGLPAAHVALADAHRAQGWAGDSSWFGTSAAVLAGDLVHVWADELLDDAPVGLEAQARARRVFATLREEVTLGQHLDLVLAARPDADEAMARRVALLKSARYTVTRPLLLGAALGDQDGAEAARPALHAYGDAVGLAFQMRDDILGLFGDPEVTGKGRLDDLREGKRTVLVLRALRLADARQRRTLLGALGDPTLDDDRAEEVRAVVAATGALASVEMLLRAEHATALEAIAGLPEVARGALADLADDALRRQR